ncbi:MAG TPA: hypothetical protein VK885_01460, partial [Desulfotignum sp.]|nr:hypothetical protein [Desulfotignum sp.]
MAGMVEMRSLSTKLSAVQAHYPPQVLETGYLDDKIVFDSVFFDKRVHIVEIPEPLFQLFPGPVPEA